MACNFFVRSSTFRPAKCWYLWLIILRRDKKCKHKNQQVVGNNPTRPKKEESYTSSKLNDKPTAKAPLKLPPFPTSTTHQLQKGFLHPNINIHWSSSHFLNSSLVVNIFRNGQDFFGYLLRKYPPSSQYFVFLISKKKKNLLFSFRDFVFVFCNLCSNYSCVDTICFLRWCNLCFLWIIPSLCLFVRFCRQLDLSLGHQTRNHIALFLGGLYVPLWAKLTSSFGNCWNFWTRRKGGRKRFW